MMSLFGFKFQNIREVIPSLGFKRHLILSLPCLFLLPSLSHELFKIGVLKITRTVHRGRAVDGVGLTLSPAPPKAALLLVTYTYDEPFSADTGPGYV